MKLSGAMIVLAFILGACGESISDKDLLLGFVADAESSIVTCKDQPDAESAANCMRESMQQLQGEWEKNLDKLQAMEDAEAEEVMAAYMQLSQTIQKEMMQIMLQQLPQEE